MTKNNEHWGSRIGLILAMAGNAVGLGNFLRFPVQAIQNGGGAFIIPYLVCFLVLGIPLLWVEWTMGRFAGKFGHHSAPFILQVHDEKRKFWRYLGGLGLFINIAIASYYCYIESWTLSYTYYSVFGTFHEIKTQHGMADFFAHYTNDPNFSTNLVPIISWIICLLLNTYVLSKGLSEGIEKVAKIGMSLLLVFGVLLALKAVNISAGEQGALYNGTDGLNFLWTPNFSSIWNGKVWLAAAGQIFFTLSLGAGAVQCYASYMRENEDVALNAMAAGWMNEFVEVVLGSSIIIPIAIGYFGVDKVKDLIATGGGGLGLGFQTLPFLFQQWGKFMGAACGLMWFGLLFFAGITSSLAMGAPVISFLEDQLNWSRKRAAVLFGVFILILGIPAVLYYKYDVLWEYDYWAGTVSLVIFALAEIILFAWVFGIEKGWTELNQGADIKPHIIFKYFIKFVTPFFLLFVFVGSIFSPANIPDTIQSHTEYVWKDSIIVDSMIKRDTLTHSAWSSAFDSLQKGSGWQFDDGSVVGMLRNQGIQNGIKKEEKAILKSKADKKMKADDKLSVQEKSHQRIVYLREKWYYINLARWILLFTLVAIMGAIYWVSSRKMKPENEEVKTKNEQIEAE
jgi:SNF family Na+-dependent transporter